MALLENQLVVKNSTLPGSGKGLFTKKMIPKGTRIVEYKGRITNWKEMKYAWENGYIESFNGKMRDELLAREIFYSLKEAQILIQMWRRQ